MTFGVKKSWFTLVRVRKYEDESRMKPYTSLAVIFILLLSAGSTLAQMTDQQEVKDKNRHSLYEWKDDTGAVHITDNLGSVPEKYRETVKKTTGRPGTESKGAEQGTKINPAAPSEKSAGENDEAKKAEWRQRLVDWKGRMADAEKRYQKLNEERTQLLSGWNTRAYVPPENMARVEQIEKEMETTKKAIDDARNMINVVIPEEARKAGIPPGWLRE